MSTPPLSVLYEDNHLLVVDKPAGLATMGVEAATPSVVKLAKAYLQRKYHKPGNVYLGVVSRLDSLVTGVLVLARTSKAADRLTKQFRENDVEKTYWALLERPPSPAAGEFNDWLIKDESQHRMVITRPGSAGAKQARLAYRTLAELPHATLVEVRLLTGRKHQIRVQFASRGLPILGDRKYGSGTDFPRGIGLHSRHVMLLHPVRHEPLAITAPLPAAWRMFERELAQFA